MKRFIVYLLASVGITIHANADCGCRTCGDQGKGSSETPSSFIGDQASAAFVRSGDPNELHGPAGYDTLRWVSINDVLHYTIYFENAEEIAAAYAQIVDVRFQFPYQQMMPSFQFGEYNFALQNYPVERGTTSYQTRIDLRDSMQIYVDVVAGVDRENNQAFWHFSSIDPITGIAPWQYDRGMLPVNDSTHIGEGYVTFSMEPAPFLQTGDTISLYADILFDQNDTIPTNRWCNRVDAGAPQSTIQPAMEADNPLLYHLSFPATDDINGCGVKRILLYQQDYAGIWQEIMSLSPDTTVDIQIEQGESYGLISIAEDYVGNREPFKPQPDIILNANMAPTDIILSDSTFRDDLPDNGYIGTLSTIDTEGGAFVYALAEGEGAIHNDLFLIQEDQLLLRQSLRCAYDTVYHIRISTTDAGGQTYSEQFGIYMSHVLFRPDNDTIIVRLCEGDSYGFRGQEYDQPGLYIQSISVSENMCDSTYVLDVSVLPYPLQPTVSIVNGTTLVSSADEGNRWMQCKETGDVLWSSDKQFIPKGDGKYYVLVDNGACSSEPSDTVIVQSEQKEASLTLSLSQGWNWFSSFLDDPLNNDVPTFLQPIQNAVDSLCGNMPDVTNLTPAESYKIRANQSIQHTWSGMACNPANYRHLLAQGWNRIGYPLSYTTNLVNTWSGFLPEEGDIIKTYEAFSTFYGGRWIGSLQTLTPGDGIMYYSQSSKNMLFSTDSVYVAVRPLHAPHANEDLHENSGLHRYPDNSTIIATLVGDENQQIPAGIYTVLAYAGEECVGIGSYVGDKIHMLMYGDVDIAVPIRFKAYNLITQEFVNIVEQISYGVGPVGSQSNPKVLHLNISEDVSMIYADASYNIYPNPVRDVLYISGNIDDIRSVAIYTLTGKIIKQFDAYNSAGIPVKDIPNGTYLVVIESNDGIRHIRKIIKSAIH